jgi:putative peptide zinc metalloprotease protein
VRAGVDGFVDTIAAPPGHRVRRGQPLFTLTDETVITRVAEIEARHRELVARHDASLVRDRVTARMVADELAYVERELAEARRRASDLTVRAAIDGTFVVPMPEDLPRRFVKRGELVGYVIDPDTITLRTVVPQADIDLVRHETRAVHVRLAERLGDSVPGAVPRVVPAATAHLPTTALGRGGGGTIAVDLRDDRGTKAVERLFQVDVQLPRRASPYVNVGGRAYVRFDHGRVPFAQQWYRQLRQLFLSTFDV